ncbi:MAG: FecR family protein [Ghiorsea sp.]
MLKLLSLTMMAFAMITLLPPSEATAASSVGRIVHAYGPTWVERGNHREKVAKGQMVFRHDSIITGPRARVKIIMGDGSKVYIGSKSRVSLRQYSLQGTNLVSAKINMLWGKARFFVSKLASKRVSFRVRTPTAVLGVRGTEFIVSVPPTVELLSRAFDQLTLADIPPLPTRTVLMEGSVNVNTNTGVSMLLTPGNTADVDANNRLSIKKTTLKDIDEHKQQTDSKPKPNKKQGKKKHAKPKQQSEKTTPENPEPSDAKDIMLDDAPDEGVETPASIPTPPSVGKSRPSGLPSDTQVDESGDDAPKSGHKVSIPSLDHNATNNAIQNLGTSTDIKLQPSFVKP